MNVNVSNNNSNSRPRYSKKRNLSRFFPNDFNTREYAGELGVNVLNNNYNIQSATANRTFFPNAQIAENLHRGLVRILSRHIKAGDRLFYVEVDGPSFDVAVVKKTVKNLTLLREDTGTTLTVPRSYEGIEYRLYKRATRAARTKEDREANLRKSKTRKNRLLSG